MVLKSDYAGQTIGGFQLLTQIARGEGSQVYLAQATTNAHHTLILKLLVGTKPSKLKNAQETLNQLQAVQRLQHPHILPISAVGIERRMPYIVMEYARGGSLRDRIAQRSAKPFSLNETLRLIFDIGEALVYAHQQNIIHGNLRPENVLFSDEDETLVADFALPGFPIMATPLEAEGEQAHQPHYLAPEQFIQGTKTSHTDQYSLASIAYELLTGETPFSSADPLLRLKLLTRNPAPPTLINSTITPTVEDALLKALSKLPEERFASITEFLEALGQPLSGEENVITEKQLSTRLSKNTLALTSDTPPPMDLLLRKFTTPLPPLEDIPEKAEAPFEDTTQETAVPGKFYPARRKNIGFRYRTLFIILLVLLVISASIFFIPSRFRQNHLPVATITPRQQITQQAPTQVIGTSTAIQRTPSGIAHGTATPKPHADPTPTAPRPTPRPDPSPTSAPLSAFLNGSFAYTPPSVDLTSEGTLDWAAWGDNNSTSFSHKNTGNSQISNCSIVGNSTQENSGSNPIGYSWSDGTPITQESNETFNTWTYTQGNGFRFTVNASTTTHTLRVYVGVDGAQGLFIASLSSGTGNSLQYQDTSLNNYNTVSNGFYTLTFRASAPNQVLTISFIILSTPNAGAIDLEAATLQ